jgi:hypothetical protein
LGSTGSCTVAMSNAPTSNLVIGISSSNPALVAPASVAVPQGNSSINFTVTAQAAAAHSIVLAASYNSVTMTQSPVVTAATQIESSAARQKPSSAATPAQSITATEIQSMSCDPGRSHRTCRIIFTISPDSGTVGLLLASSSQSVTLPATLTVQPGQLSIRFRIDAISPVKDHATTITAQRKRPAKAVLTD